MDKLTDNAPHLQFFDTSRGIDLIYDSSHAHHHHGNDEGHTHDSIQHDEHQQAIGVEPTSGVRPTMPKSLPATF